MNRQRKVVITVTYNDLGMIVDTKAEELNLSAQPNLQLTCNQLATDCISRQDAVDALDKRFYGVPKELTTEILQLRRDLRERIPSAEPEIKPIDYCDCANAMLKMWIGDVVTDGEYYRIMNKLNKHELEKRNNGGI